nr:MAG TPA_asm: hypothetical protein [Caudoviricetes sp.]
MIIFSSHVSSSCLRRYEYRLLYCSIILVLL